jgi:hypothetical protein
MVVCARRCLAGSDPKTPPRVKQKYHRGSWHYINLPTFTNPRDAATLRQKLRNNTQRQWQLGEPELDLNIVQALKRASAGLHNRELRDRERALHLCWLLHLVADLHQPLHATSLYTPRRFSNGDAGGNRIAVKNDERRNLHAVWDGAISTSRSFESDKLRARQLLDHAKHRSEDEDLDFETWLTENYELAGEFAYRPALLAHIQAGEKRKAKLSTFRPTAAYLTTTREIAEWRAVTAASRLTRLLIALRPDS